MGAASQGSHLRPAKAAVRRVGGLVGAAQAADDAHVGDLVAAVRVQQRAVHDRRRQVLGSSQTRGRGHVFKKEGGGGVCGDMRRMHAG